MEITGNEIVVIYHEQDAKFVGAGQLLGKISLMGSTLPDETTTSNRNLLPERVTNPEGKRSQRLDSSLMDSKRCQAHKRH